MNYRQKEEFQSMLNQPVACYQITVSFRNFAQNGVFTFHKV